jgi:hypothetical protein
LGFLRTVRVVGRQPLGVAFALFATEFSILLIASMDPMIAAIAITGITISLFLIMAMTHTSPLKYQSVGSHL